MYPHPFSLKILIQCNDNEVRIGNLSLYGQYDELNVLTFTNLLKSYGLKSLWWSLVEVSSMMSVKLIYVVFLNNVAEEHVSSRQNFLKKKP